MFQYIFLIESQFIILENHPQILKILNKKDQILYLLLLIALIFKKSKDNYLVYNQISNAIIVYLEN